MKDRNQVLLEQVYQSIRLRQALLAEGYSNEQIDLYLTEGALKDGLQRLARKVGSIALAASMTLGALTGGNTAQAAPINPEIDKEIQSIIGGTKAELQQSGVLDVTTKLKQALENISKDTAGDLQKIDNVDAKITALGTLAKTKLNPDLVKYQWSNVMRGVTELTANGKLTGAPDRDTQLKVLDQIGIGINQGKFGNASTNSFTQADAINKYVQAVKSSLAGGKQIPTVGQVFPSSL